MTKQFLGTTIFVGCTNSPLCLSQPVSYMCSGENGTGSSDDLLRWRIRDSSNAPDGGTAYAEGTYVSTPRIIGTYFETVLTSSADPMRSNVSFSPVLAISNYTVLCDIVGTKPVGCPIIIAGRTHTGNVMSCDQHVIFNFRCSSRSCF